MISFVFVFGGWFFFVWFLKMYCLLKFVFQFDLFFLEKVDDGVLKMSSAEFEKDGEEGVDRG